MGSSFTVSKWWQNEASVLLHEPLFSSLDDTVEINEGFDNWQVHVLSALYWKRVPSGGLKHNNWFRKQCWRFIFSPSLQLAQAKKQTEKKVTESPLEHLNFRVSQGAPWNDGRRVPKTSLTAICFIKISHVPSEVGVHTCATTRSTMFFVDFPSWKDFFSNWPV